LKEIDELLKEDDKFLESLDQVALKQLEPEALGLTSLKDNEDKESDPIENPIENQPTQNQDESGKNDAS
jgi:hypothetical protein